MVRQVKMRGVVGKHSTRTKIKRSYLGGYCEIDKEKKNGVKIDKHIKYRILRVIKREYDKVSRKNYIGCNIIKER